MKKTKLIRNVRCWGIMYSDPNTLRTVKEISFNGDISYSESPFETRYKNKLCRLNGGPSRIYSDGRRDWFKIKGTSRIWLHTRSEIVGNNRSCECGNAVFTRIERYGITRKVDSWGIRYFRTILDRDRNSPMSKQINIGFRSIYDIYYNGTMHRPYVFSPDKSSYVFGPTNIGTNGYRSWIHRDNGYIWSEEPETGGNRRKSWGNKSIKIKAWKYKNGS